MTTRSEIRQRWRHHKVAVNGVTLHYVEAGSGPLVLLLHGFPDFWYTWTHQIAALSAAGFHVVAPDLRGYNVSDKPRGVSSYSIETLAGDVAALIEHFGRGPAMVAGHDWGGVIAWYLPRLRPDLVERLVILNVPHPLAVLRAMRSPRQIARFWYQFFFQIPLLPEKLLLAKDCRRLRMAMTRLAVSAEAFTDADLERMARAWKRPYAMTAALNYYRALYRRSPFGITGGVPVDSRVLLIWGERERVFIPSSVEATIRLVDNLEIVRIEGAGHFVHLDRPDEVSEAMIRFLRE
ncbi:MAG TPA: alpha/beta hydrolase [Thermoanaerobaculia bacterium]|nr:alpha/beta hydrolase [Thermoanaerobaculia bacterium]